MGVGLWSEAVVYWMLNKVSEVIYLYMEKKRILVAEDERPIAKAMELKLNHSGFDVRVAFDGEEALKILETEKFDLILLDLVMPKMNGFQTLQEIKNRGIETPVVVSSNLSQEEDLKKAQDLGAIDFLIKSDTQISEIVERIKEYVGA